MDQSDWVNDQQDNPQDKSERPAPSRNRRQPSPPQQPQKKQDEDYKKDQLSISNWLDDANQQEPEVTPGREGGRGRAAKVEQVLCSSFLKEKLADINAPNAELEPDTPNTSWFHQQPPKQESTPHRGTRTTSFVPKQQETQRRGNRGNRDNDQSNGFRKKNNFSDGNNYPENTSENNWNDRDNRESGFRGRGRGSYRGRGGGGYKNYRQGGNREGQEDQQQSARGNRSNNNNSNYRQKTEYERSSNYNNNNNGQNRYEGRNYNNNYNYNSGYRRNYNNDFNQNRNYFSERQEPNNPPPAKIYNQVKPLVVQKEESTQQIQAVPTVPVPKGRKTWPQASIYIQKCKLTITYRQIHEFACKLLMIPYSSIKMEYYPGNIINSSSFDYKKKILSKGEEISKPGHVYLQKALDISSLIGLAFLKIDQNKIEESLKIGVKEVLKIAQKIEKESFQSIIIPISDSLGDPAFVIRPLLQNLQNCRKIKEIYVTTNQPKCFIEAVRSFADQIDILLNENQIYID